MKYPSINYDYIIAIFNIIIYYKLSIIIFTRSNVKYIIESFNPK